MYNQDTAQTPVLMEGWLQGTRDKPVLNLAACARMEMPARSTARHVLIISPGYAKPRAGYAGPGGQLLAPSSCLVVIISAAALYSYTLAGLDAVRGITLPVPLSYYLYID